MRHPRRIHILFLAVAAMIGLAFTARTWIASHPTPQKNNVIFTEDYELAGDYADALAVVADTVTLRVESRVTGAAALVGSERTTVDGLVEGSVTLVGDALAVGESGIVRGDLLAMGSDIRLAGSVAGKVTVIGDSLLIQPGAQLAGAIVACVGTLTDQRTNTPPVKPCHDEAALLAVFGLLQGLSQGLDLSQRALPGAMNGLSIWFGLAASLLLTGLSALAVMVFPRRFSLMQEAIVYNPRSLAALGVMALLLLVGLAGGMTALWTWLPVTGVILFPIGLLVLLALLVLVVCGWITLALLLGDFTLRHVAHSTLPPAIAVTLGSLLLFGLWHILALIPFGGVVSLLMMAALGSAGLGGALATRLGARPLRRRYFVQG